MTTIDVKSVAARTSLSVLQTGMWGATRLHRAETREENVRHSTNAARVTVRISDHHALRGIRKLHGEAYDQHVRLTLPTVQAGMRLLPAGREIEHSAMMNKFADRHNELVREFLDDYDNERATAPARLGTLFDASVWPSHAEMEHKFTFQTRYLATPTDGAWADWLIESSRAADADIRERLAEALTRVRDRCASEGSLFSSVFDSIRELSALVPDLDLSGTFAPVVQAMAPLTDIEAEDLRKDKGGRQATADRAKDILSVLNGITLR